MQYGRSWDSREKLLFTIVNKTIIIKSRKGELWNTNAQHARSSGCAEYTNAPRQKSGNVRIAAVCEPHIKVRTPRHGKRIGKRVYEDSGKDKNQMIDDIELETECILCFGRDRQCVLCHGCGMVPTDLGDKILALVRRHLHSAMRNRMVIQNKLSVVDPFQKEAPCYMTPTGTFLREFYPNEVDD